eukprot:TRINITY_DN5659_c0_g1_i3.p1 TRINITY_DN5659_c0_g1~~TRINITY_DN5659_c0_g1_i3.p1  ORF type:complete len:116 (+),score=2.85 TRINITY_DN5659_c0_g1_i3:321-668(+)
MEFLHDLRYGFVLEAGGIPLRIRPERFSRWRFLHHHTAELLKSKHPFNFPSRTFVLCDHRVLAAAPPAILSHSVPGRPLNSGRGDRRTFPPGCTSDPFLETGGLCLRLFGNVQVF